MPENGTETVLVTGGAGYIGSHLVALLLRRGYRVRVLDNFTFGGRSIIPYLTDPCFTLCHGDIREQRQVDTALEGADAVVHLAAIVGDPACRTYPDLARRVNGDGARLVCDRAMEAGVGRFVFASTCSNYGKSKNPDVFVDETSPLNPVSLYAELKVEFEEHLLGLKRDGFDAVVLRFATAYGLSPRPRFDLTLNEFTRELTLGRRLEVYGRRFWRPYAHAYDLAAACLRVLEAPGDTVSGQAFNIGGTEENYRKESLVTLILKVLGDGADKVVYVERDEDPRDYRVNFDKAKGSLGIELSRTVDDGIREIVEAVRSGLINDPDSGQYRNS